MARLPSERYLVQQIDGQVVLFEDFTEREITRFDPGSVLASGHALEEIAVSELADEDRCFACFWAGYFGFYAGRIPAELTSPSHHIGLVDGGAHVVLFEADGNNPARELVRFDPSDANAAARAQKAIYDSGLRDADKRLAHFMSGYYYAEASGA